MSGPVPKHPHLSGIGENSSHSPNPHLHTPCFLSLPPMLVLSDGKLPFAFFLLLMENHQKNCFSSEVEQKLLYRRKVRRMIWAVSGLGGLEAFSCLPSGSCQRPASSQEEGWNPRVLGLPTDSPNKQLLCSKTASLGAHLVFTATRKP